MGQCFPCKAAKSRHNKLAKTSKLTEIKSNSNPLASALLGVNDDDYAGSQQDDQWTDQPSSYAAPQHQGRASNGGRGRAESDDESCTSNPLNASISSSQAGRGTVTPAAAEAVRAVKGKTVLAFEHSSKQGSFKKRGQNVKSWKRRLFVLDGGELAYFKDGLMADRGGEVSLCGATLSYLDKSATSGCAAIEIHSGKRDLLMECDSSALAEEWTSAIYDVIITEDLAYLRSHFPAAPAPTAAFNSIRDSRRFQRLSGLQLGADRVVHMCEMMELHVHSAQEVLARGADCILFGVDENGRANVQTGHIKLSDDRRSLLWSAVSVLKKQYSRKGSVQPGTAGAGPEHAAERVSRIPLDSVVDVLLGSLSYDDDSVSSGVLSAGSVLSLVTATHSLEIELDTTEVPTASCYINNDTLSRIASLSSEGPAADVRLTTASAFTRPSSMFSFSAEPGDSGKSPEELAACPQIVSRHPFLKALRMVLLLQGHMQMVRYVKRTLTNSGMVASKKVVASSSVGGSGSGKRLAGMRPVERARGKVLV